MSSEENASAQWFCGIFLECSKTFFISNEELIPPPTHPPTHPATKQNKYTGHVAFWTETFPSNFREYDIPF